MHEQVLVDFLRHGNPIVFHIAARALSCSQTDLVSIEVYVRPAQAVEFILPRRRMECRFQEDFVLSLSGVDELDDEIEEKANGGDGLIVRAS